MTTTPPVARAPALKLQRIAGVWVWLSIAAALLAAAGNGVGLSAVARIYGKETRAFINQAIAQDAVNLAVVSPAIIILALLTHRGSLRASLIWLGGLAFTTYNYVIYTFSIHVGPLFLVWVAVLGLTTFALIGGLSTLDTQAVKERFGSAPTRLTGWFLIAMATLFALLWLKDIVPAILTGRLPESVRELALPSNPVHVLDLSFFLPAAFATGALLQRGRAWTYTTAPGLLVFLVLTGLPVIATPFIADAHGDAPAWAVLPPIFVITIVSFAVLAVFMRAARPSLSRSATMSSGRTGTGSSGAASTMAPSRRSKGP